MDKVKITNLQVDDLEEFKEVKGFEQLYKVSNLGNVLSIKTGKILKPTINMYGYPQLVLSKNGKDKTVKIHRLVALCFIANVQNKRTVNHKDGIKTNNHTSNLEWATHGENIKHAFVTGLRSPASPNANGRHQGENTGCNKLCESDVIYIRQNAKKNGGLLTNVTLAKMFGVTNSGIGYVVNGRVWKHVVGGVNHE